MCGTAPLLIGTGRESAATANPPPTAAKAEQRSRLVADPRATEHHLVISSAVEQGLESAVFCDVIEHDGPWAHPAKFGSERQGSGTFATDPGWIDGTTASAVEGMIVRP